MDMTHLLAALGRQTLVLTLTLPVLLAVRQPLLRRFGAPVAYASWVLLPLLMLAAWLPASAPAQALRASVVARIEPLLGGPAAALPPAPDPWWPAALAVAWLAGALLCAVRLVWLQRRFMQNLAPAGANWQSPSGSGPALVGLWRPRLALPLDFEQRFDAQQQRLVLAHEDVHRQRHDNHWNALAAALCVLHWFNPLAWLALRRMRADQELACDARVIAEHPGSEAAYGRALLLAQGSQFATGLPWASWQSTHPLIERIEMLKQHSGPAARRKFGMVLVGLMAVAGAGTVHALRADAGADAAPQAASIELRMEIAITDSQGGSTRTQRSQPTIRVHAGKPANVILNGSPDKPTPDQVSIEVIAEELGDDKIKISTEIKKGDPLATVSKPKIITKNGMKALIEIGNEGPTGKDMLSIAITPTVLGKAKP